MAYGKIKADAIIYDNNGSDVEKTIASLASAAPAADPAFTGTPTAPTASQGTNTTQIATTAFVNAEIAADTAVKAPLASPTFTGVPAAPTASTGTNTTQIATTAFVQAALPTIDPDTAKTDVAQTFTPAQTFTAASVHNGGLTVDGPYRQAEEDVSSGTTFDLSTGNYFAATYGSSNVTLSFTNPPAAGTVHCFTIQLFINGGTITWPSSVEFPNNDTAPVLAQGKHALFVFTTDDGGVTYRGAALVDYNT